MALPAAAALISTVAVLLATGRRYSMRSHQAGKVLSLSDRRSDGVLCATSMLHGFPRPHIRLLVVTRWQDRPVFESRLRKDISMFVEPECFSTVLLVDDEDPKNHQWGDGLLAWDPRIAVEYVSRPDNHETLFDGFGRGGVNKDGNTFDEPDERRFGYERQQWNYFHADKYSGSAEIIGAMDSDGCITTFLTHEDIFTLKGKIKIHATSGDRWKGGDSLALNFSSEFDVMYTDTFPVFFWTDTFTALRTDIAGRLGGEAGTFENAFQVFNREGYSQFNILANWALTHEPERYELIFHCDTEAHGRNPRSVTLGAHKNFGWCNDRSTYRHSCAVAFGSGVFLSKVLFRSGWTFAAPSFPYDQPEHLLHEKFVVSRVKELQMATRLDMARACSYYSDSTSVTIPTIAMFVVVGWCISRRRGGVWKAMRNWL